MKLKEELIKEVHSSMNENFHFSKLDFVTQVWISHLCEILDKKLRRAI